MLKYSKIAVCTYICFHCQFQKERPQPLELQIVDHHQENHPII